MKFSFSFKSLNNFENEKTIMSLFKLKPREYNKTLTVINDIRSSHLKHPHELSD